MRRSRKALTRKGSEVRILLSPFSYERVSVKEILILYGFLLAVVSLPVAAYSEGTAPIPAQDATSDQDIGPLMDRLRAALHDEKHEEAKKILKEGENLSPNDPQIPSWRELIERLENEPDQKKRAELYLQFSVNQLSGFVDQLDTVKQKLTKLNQSLDELGPQNPEEELCYAIAGGEQAKAEVLLAKGVSANAKDRMNSTALTYAAMGGYPKLTKLLLERGADVNAKDPLGGTALLFAASKGSLETIQLLIDAGADVNAKAKTGVTPMGVAAANHHPEAVDLLKQAGAKE